MEDVVFRQKIGNSNVGVIFIFDDYTESDFRKDLEYVKVYQSKKELSSNPQERKQEVDLKFYGKVPFDAITFNVFIDSLATFANIFFHVIKSDQHLITSQDFNLQLKVKRVPDGDYYFSYGDEDNISDAENACFYVAGIWLVNNIAIPRVLGKGDYTIVQRYMLHELIHHHDKINKNDFWNREHKGTLLHYEKKIKNLYMRKSAFFLNCLYTSLFNLREEGLADFNARKETPMDMNFEGIMKYNQNLVKLSYQRKKSQAEEFYEKNISYGNLTLSGEYSNGRNMCLTIALAISHQKNKAFTITMDRKQFSSRQLGISEALATGKTIYISDLNKEVIVEAIQKIRPLGHYYFVHEYEKACDVLGIKNEFRIMTKRRFYDLVHNAIAQLKKEKISRLTGSGFRYSEPDLKEV